MQDFKTLDSLLVANQAAVYFFFLMKMRRHTSILGVISRLSSVWTGNPFLFSSKLNVSAQHSYFN